ncbi:MAG: NADP-dependent oxidoreductase [Alphaproteobacteria bacterium]|nr:NADP-dependent oxidoreductase [Alphaproteobacteria bacterium]
MKAVRMHAHGGPGVLVLEDVPDPVPAAGEVLVAIKAASVNAADWKVRSGISPVPLVFPHILGRDFSGVVETAGPDTDMERGTEVYAVCPPGMEGGYAEKISIGAQYVARKPENLSHVEAAAIGLAALTALVTIEDTLKLKRGEKILIQGGAGGVAGMAIQLAHHLGAEVVTTARAENHAYVRGLGADQVIDYTEEDPAVLVGDCDAAFDTVGGACIAQSFAVLTPGGRAAFIAGGADAPIPPREDVTALRPAVNRSRALMDRVTAYVEAGILRLPEITTMPLSAAVHAHELSEAKHVRGKLVFDIGD